MAQEFVSVRIARPNPCISFFCISGTTEVEMNSESVEYWDYSYLLSGWGTVKGNVHIAVVAFQRLHLSFNDYYFAHPRGGSAPHARRTRKVHTPWGMRIPCPFFGAQCACFFTWQKEDEEEFDNMFRP